MTRAEFVERWLRESRLTELPAHRYPEPCDCGDEICEGWQMVNDD